MGYLFLIILLISTILAVPFFIFGNIFCLIVIFISLIPLYKAIKYPTFRRDYLIIWSFSLIWYPSAFVYIVTDMNKILREESLIYWMFLELLIMIIYYPIAYFAIKINHKPLKQVSKYCIIGNFFGLFCMSFLLMFISFASRQ